MSTERRTHKTSRTDENFDEAHLRTLTGQQHTNWSRYVVKELIDNSLDFTEESDKAPELTIEIEKFDRKHIESVRVEDNGPGMSEEDLKTVFEDIDSFGGTKRHYALPTRGNQGNALMTILGIQSLCDGSLSVASRRVEYEVVVDKNAKEGHTVALNTIGESPVDGLSVEVKFKSKKRRYTNLSQVTRIIKEFVSLNPHARFEVSIDGEVTEYSAREDPTNKSFSLAKRATTGKVTWFSMSEFESRVEADLRAEPDLSIEDFVREFCKLSSKSKAKTVISEMERMTKSRERDSDIRTIRGLFDESYRQKKTLLQSLYIAMCRNTDDYGVNGLDKTLGSVGSDLKQGAVYSCSKGNPDKVLKQLREGEKIDPEGLGDITIHYGRGDIIETDNEKVTPFYFELAAVPQKIREKDENPFSEITFGFNQSVSYTTPNIQVEVNTKNKNSKKQTLHSAFEDVGHNFAVVCNLTCPNIPFTDKGKQTINTTELFEGVIGDVVSKAIRKIERDIRPALNDVRVDTEDDNPGLDKSKKAPSGFIKDFVFNNFEKAYDLTSGGNDNVIVLMRQMYYQMRPLFLKEVEDSPYEYSSRATIDNPKPLDLHYETFTTNVKRYEEDVLGERVIHRDRRGFFAEPHSNEQIELSTASVKAHAPDIEEYGTILLIEKTGFYKQLHDQFELDKKYDVGLINAKGMSTGACRDLIEKIQKKAQEEDRDIPLYTLTDLDISGQGIAYDAGKADEISTVSEFNAKLLGMTLDTVEEYDLAIEPAGYKDSQLAKLDTLREEGAVDEELYDFLSKDGGQRVEINALSLPELAEYLENEFEKRGVEKVEPDEKDVDTLETNQKFVDKKVKGEHYDGVGRGILQHIRNQHEDFVSEVMTSDDVPGPDDLHDRFEGEDIAIGEDAAEQIHEEVLDELSGMPPKGWGDINEELIDEHEEKKDSAVEDHKDEVSEAVEEFIREHITIDIGIDIE